MSIRFDILTLFPGLIEGVLEYSILGRALDRGEVRAHAHDLRDWTEDLHRTVDDVPYGGGVGMVLKLEPIHRALESLGAGPEARAPGTRVVLLSPQGRPFTQAVAEEYSSLDQVIFICGRYEGVDERVSQYLVDEELSVGDYVLSGGEIPSLLVMEAVVRLLPGVLGDPESSRQDSHSEVGLLDHPHFTRPREYHRWVVPEVLLSGHHERVREWRRREALRATLEKRPDLLLRAELSDTDRETLKELLEGFEHPQKTELERFLDGNRTGSPTEGVRAGGRR